MLADSFVSSWVIKFDFTVFTLREWNTKRERLLIRFAELGEHWAVWLHMRAHIWTKKLTQFNQVVLSAVLREQIEQTQAVYVLLLLTI